MKQKWTTGQQKVIDLRNRNILVSAAAGSGKTAVLVERIIKKITDPDHPVDIDRLLVVTFTKAAAAEMRSRIASALESRLEENPKDTNLEQQLSLLHNAQITTIDSFCQYIIRNYFHVIGLDPMFQVADETDLKLMKEDVLKELIEERYRCARENENQAFLDFTESFAPGRSDSRMEDLVQKLYTISQSYPWPEEQLHQWEELYQCKSVKDLEEAEWVQILVRDIREELRAYESLAREAERICLELDGPQAYLPAVQSELRQIRELAECESYRELYEGFCRFHPERLKAIRSKEVDPEKKEQVQELRKGYLKKGIQEKKENFFFQSPEEMEEDIRKMGQPIHELIQLTLDFSEAFAVQKREEGLIDFNDMEHFALQILVERTEQGGGIPSATAKELQEHYEEILTDEYQDSNYVQEMLLSSLCRAPEQHPYLFMVGDVKQSIYQFRLARPDLFMDKYNRYTVAESKEQRIDLHQNFRSRASVLNASNYFFEKLMREDFGGICYDEAARLVPGADFGECEKRTADQTEIILLEQKSEAGKALGKRVLEAAAIGERIREMVQGENPLYIKGKEGYRPVEYRDIVILIRSLQGWSEEFIETLTEMGIPAYSPTKTGYFSTLEVETMLNVLRVIDNPRQDIPLVSVMRSCLFQITDEELAFLGTIPDTINYWDAVCRLAAQEAEQPQIPEEVKQALKQKVSNFVDTIARYRELSKTSSVYELLGKIYQETEYYSMMSAMPAGERRRANLDILLQQAVEFADNGHRGIFGFCQYIESLQKSNVDFGEASVTGENANVVQIMSIHKSKGLEFPVVFVAGMGKQFNLQDIRQATIIDMDYGIGAEYVDLELRMKQPTLLKKYMAEHSKKSILAEEIRILYVAFTRAKEKLFLSGTVSGVSKKMAGWKQKGREISQITLSGARTYLDWIMPALAARPAFQGCLTQLEAAGEEDNVNAAAEDDLFRLQLISPEHILSKEKEELQEGIIQKEQLLHWDDQIVYHSEMERLIRKRIGYQYPYEAEQQLPVKVSVSEMKRRTLVQEDVLLPDYVQPNFSEMEIPQPAFRKETEKISSAKKGTLYHLVMEHLPYEELTKAFDFHSFLEQLAKAGYLTEEECGVLDIRRFQQFAQTEIAMRMRDAAEKGKLYREQPFMLGLSAQEIEPEIPMEETILMQGIIDAYFEEEGELVLVDYKTDWVRAGQERELVERYHAQLNYYARALEQLTGKKVRERVIYSFALGKEVRE